MRAQDFHGVIDELEILKLEVEVWKKTIDVQQHFNDMQMRIRNFAITLLVAVVGAAAIALKEKMNVGRFPLAALLLWAGAGGWFAFYLMDVFWYHKLLKGAVAHATSIETRLKPTIAGLQLSTAISAASPVYVFGCKGLALRSTPRAHIFYLGMFAIVVSLGLIVDCAKDPANGAAPSSASSTATRGAGGTTGKAGAGPGGSAGVGASTGPSH